MFGKINLTIAFASLTLEKPSWFFRFHQFLKIHIFQTCLVNFQDKKIVQMRYSKNNKLFGKKHGENCISVEKIRVTVGKLKFFGIPIHFYTAVSTYNFVTEPQSRYSKP